MESKKKKKAHNKCNFSFTSVYKSNYEGWSFNSGCSRHMMSDSLLFADLKECNLGQDTFGDGVKEMLLVEEIIID